MNTDELKKILKKNGVHFYSYWSKPKLIDLAKINNLLPEPEPKPVSKPEPNPEEEKLKFVNYERLRNIRNNPCCVKLIDINTKEEKTFPSIYKTAQFLDKCPQTIRHFGKKKGVWNNKYQIVIE